eukprot:gene3189-8226_t
MVIVTGQCSAVQRSGEEGAGEQGSLQAFSHPQVLQQSQRVYLLLAVLDVFVDYNSGIEQLWTTDIQEEYHIYWEKVIATGTNGPIFSCEHKQSGRPCALKCLPFTDVGYREAKLHRQLGCHPNIVTVADIFEGEITLPGVANPVFVRNTEYKQSRRILLVTERMHGGELFDVISKCKSFTEEESRGIMRQLALAVAHCHQNDVAHRDIKPENFLLTTNDLTTSTICLTDFGYAKPDNGDLQTPVFTPYYVSPQVLRSLTIEQRKQQGCIPPTFHFIYGGKILQYTAAGGDIHKSCDMWALGVILYILLCGYPPFRPNNTSNPLPMAMRQKIIMGSIHFHPKHWSNVSHEAKELVRLLLHVNERERLTAEELLRHSWITGKSEATDANIPDSLHNNNEDREPLNCVNIAHQQKQDSQLVIPPLEDCDNALKERRKNKTRCLGNTQPQPQLEIQQQNQTIQNIKERLQ